ncbi:hypothetical protein ACLH3T_001579 [Flavobacterium psychrophilum]
MIKTIVTPQNNSILLSIPNNYIGKEIEVLLYSKEEVAEEKPKIKKTMADFWGTLSDQTANEMLKEVEESRKGWEDRLKKQF